MTNNGLDDTPIQPASEPKGESGFEETRPVDLGAGAGTDMDSTLPAAVSPSPGESSPPISGFEDTSPTALEPPAGSEATSLTRLTADQGGALAPASGDGGMIAPPGVKTGGKRRFGWLLYALLGVLVLLGIALLSAAGGYGSGISLRKNAENTQVALIADEQFQLGLQDISEGQYQRARQRFEYVIQLNPNYPGVTEKLADVLLELNITATPTLLPTPTVPPTPDLRSVQQLYDQGKQFLANKEWTNAIEALLQLRKSDPNFQAVDVDGMLFLALRNRGGDKILKEADLEGGIYDLTLASRFGPLDAEAQGLLNWTSLYITGASFWGIDWEQAEQYFAQVAPQLPNLMDGSKMTASERLRIALFENGNALAREGRYCKAVEKYQQSLSIAPNPEVQQAFEAAAGPCQSGNAPGPQTTKKPKDTPSP